MRWCMPPSRPSSTRSVPPFAPVPPRALSASWHRPLNFARIVLRCRACVLPSTPRVWSSIPTWVAPRSRNRLPKPWPRLRAGIARSSTASTPVRAGRARSMPRSSSARSPVPRTRWSSTTMPPRCCWCWRHMPQARRSSSAAASLSRSAAVSVSPMLWRPRVPSSSRSGPPTARTFRTTSAPSRPIRR